MSSATIRHGQFDIRWARAVPTLDYRTGAGLLSICTSIDEMVLFVRTPIAITRRGAGRKRWRFQPLSNDSVNLDIVSICSGRVVVVQNCLGCDGFCETTTWVNRWYWCAPRSLVFVPEPLVVILSVRGLSGIWNLWNGCRIKKRAKKQWTWCGDMLYAGGGMPHPLLKLIPRKYMSGRPLVQRVKKLSTPPFTCWVLVRKMLSSILRSLSCRASSGFDSSLLLLSG